MLMKVDGPSWEYELKHANDKRIVAGIDEAGRGPLAGPVVVAAVIAPIGYEVSGMNDSKKLTEKKRELLFSQMMEGEELCYSIITVDADKIDELNILGATHYGMRRAAESLKITPDVCLIDGLPVRSFPFEQEAIVKGDSKSFSIAMASVLAKVTRDRLMLQYAEMYPEYGFERHKGYGTKEHLKALHEHGPCPIHRRSFAPVAQQRLFF